MDFKNLTLKIVKKTGDGAYVKVTNGHIELVPWDKFNAEMEMLPNNVCKYKPEVAEKLTEFDKLLDEITVVAARISVLQVTNTNPTEMLSLSMVLGEKTEAAANLVGCSIMEVMALVKNNLAKLRNPKFMKRVMTEEERREQREEMHARKKAEKEAAKKAEEERIKRTGSFADLPGADKLANLFK